MTNVPPYDSNIPKQYYVFESQNVQVVEKRAAGIFSVAGEDALNQARIDQELWELLLRQEIAFSKDPSS